MSFANVNGKELGAAALFAVHLGEMAHLAAEGRSSVASENKNERARSDAFMQIEGELAVERNQSHVRRGVAYAQDAAMPLGEGVAKKAVDVARPAHEMAEDAEANQQKRHERNTRPFQPAHEKQPSACKKATALEHLPEHVLQDAAVLEVSDLKWCVHARHGHEGLFFSVGVARANHHFFLRFEVLREAFDVEGLKPSQTQRSGGFSGQEFKGQHPHSHKIVAGNALITFR